jgi:hypothetical protein
MNKTHQGALFSDFFRRTELLHPPAVGIQLYAGNFSPSLFRWGFEPQLQFTCLCEPSDEDTVKVGSKQLTVFRVAERLVQVSMLFGRCRGHGFARGRMKVT